MNTIFDTPRPQLGSSAVAIGVFDGVHRGHRALLRKLRATAERLSCPSVVLTFHPHPRSVVDPERAPRLLCSLERRLELLESTGSVDLCLVLRFDRERSVQAPEDFVADVLVDALAARAVLVGSEFRFGQRRRGDVALLGRMGSHSGFVVEDVPLLRHRPGSARACSSSLARQLLTDGDLWAVRDVLGRPPELSGLAVADGGAGRRRWLVRLDPDGGYARHGAYMASVQLHTGYQAPAIVIVPPDQQDAAAVVALPASSRPLPETPPRQRVRMSLVEPYRHTVQRRRPALRTPEARQGE